MRKAQISSAMESMEQERQSTKRRAHELDNELKLKELEIARERQLEELAMKRRELELNSEFRMKELEFQRQRQTEEAADRKANREFQQSIMEELRSKKSQ